MIVAVFMDWSTVYPGQSMISAVFVDCSTVCPGESMNLAVFVDCSGVTTRGATAPAARNGRRPPAERAAAAGPELAGAGSASAASGQPRGCG